MENLARLRQWTGDLNNLANGYKKSQILFTAFEAGLFELLESWMAPGDIAPVLGWSERGTAMLLDGLLALDLVAKQEGRFKNTPMASACLVRNGEAYQGNILSHNMNSRQAWADLPERVRTGTCAPPGEKRTGDALRAFILGMSNIARLSAQEVLQAVDLSGYRNMLDLAGGPGTYGIAFQQACPELHVTLFDQPEVVEIAREQVAEAGLTSRFSFITGDCHKDGLGGEYDLVFMSNIIHSFDNAENARLVRRVHEALAPGGTIIIKDFIMENDRSGPAYGLLFALHMLVHTPAGNTYTYEEIKAWTDAAGFRPGRSLSLTPQTRLWIAEK